MNGVNKSLDDFGSGYFSARSERMTDTEVSKLLSIFECGEFLHSVKNLSNKCDNHRGFLIMFSIFLTDFTRRLTGMV